MKIAIASGKGGTGKTTIATNLAYILAAKGNNTVYIDCDVEEPNGHLFLKPEWNDIYKVTVKIPLINKEKCDYCGECSSICRFNALAVLSDQVLVFPSLCHSCGGCYYVCPQKAIDEIDREIGEVKYGKGKGVITYEGRLNVGEAISPPIIKHLRQHTTEADYIVIDSPPGTSCPVIESVKDVDYVVLVTEPTPFGLNDLILAIGMARQLNLQFGVIINRYGIGDRKVESYCIDQGIDILLKIPNNRQIAEICSNGKLITEQNTKYISLFEKLIAGIENPPKMIGSVSHNSNYN